MTYVAVFPQSVEEATAYLNRLGISGVEVKQAPISAVVVTGTPASFTPIIEARLTNYRVGKLTADKETEVVNQVNSL